MYKLIKSEIYNKVFFRYKSKTIKNDKDLNFFFENYLKKMITSLKMNGFIVSDNHSQDIPKALIGRNGDLIKKGPIYTNKETDLGVFQNHKSQLNDLELNKKSTFNYNYALSSWIWINPQPASTSEAYNKPTTLLNYGNILKIIFNKNKIEFFAQTTRDSVLVKESIKIYELKNIPYQKWNNFVFNYSGGTLDIFINGKLVSSNINITPVMYYDKMTAGATNGIYGGIRDIVYYDKVLSRGQIEAMNNE